MLSSIRAEIWRTFLLRNLPSPGKRPIRSPPFVVPGLRKKPRRALLASHDRSNKSRMGSTSTKIKDSPHQVSLQAWLLYTLRYIPTWGLSDSWYSFGCLASQLNHVSIVARLAVTENSTLSIRYGRELRKHLQRLSRRRGAKVDFCQLLSEENTVIKKESKNRNREEPS